MKEKYLLELENKLYKYGISDHERIIAFYIEAIEDRIDSGMTEEEAINDIGNVDEVMVDIVQDLSLKQAMKVKVNKAKEKTKYYLAYIAPLMLLYSLCVGSCYLVLLVLSLSLYAILFSVTVVGVVGLFYGIIIMISGSVGLGLLVLVSSIVAIIICMFSFHPINLLVKKIIGLFKKLIIKIKSKLVIGE